MPAKVDPVATAGVLLATEAAGDLRQLFAAMQRFVALVAVGLSKKSTPPSNYSSCGGLKLPSRWALAGIPAGLATVGKAPNYRLQNQ